VGLSFPSFLFLSPKCSFGMFSLVSFPGLCSLVSPRVNKLCSLSSCTSLPFRRSSSFSSSFQYDVGIIGGGIIGLATARELLVRSGKKLRVVLLEKERHLASE